MRTKNTSVGMSLQATMNTGAAIPPTAPHCYTAIAKGGVFDEKAKVALFCFPRLFSAITIS